MIKVKSTSIVEVTLRIHPSDTWDENCKIDQIRKQAAESAINTLRQSLAGDLQRNKIQIIAEPKVTAVLVTEER